MTQVIIEKAPAEKFKIGLYYRPPDVDDTNTLVSATAVSTPAGLTLDGDPVVSGQQVLQMIAGGVTGKDYVVQFTVLTSNGSSYCSPNHEAIIVRVL
ncbi:MAG: hypothetical protein MUP28_02295 [Candidatus Aminicenantes bacterium]|nr:hypothetical protein [Candidatus Aminicenantes bacterium]